MSLAADQARDCTIQQGERAFCVVCDPEIKVHDVFE